METKIVPIVQIMKLRPKDFKSLAQVTQLMHGRVGTPSQASGSPLCSMLLGHTSLETYSLPVWKCHTGVPQTRMHHWRILLTTQTPILWIWGEA